jgi:large subunit ribosomal protein L23
LLKEQLNLFFDVTVIKVNSCNLPRKKRRIGRFEGYKSKYKKVIVTLADEDSIEILPEI